MRDRNQMLPFIEELDRWQDAGRVARLWLRDDDAQAPTPALETLLSQLAHYEAPCMLAIIPMRAGEALAARLGAETGITIAMHGAWHTNHAQNGFKSTETPIERGLNPILIELAQSRMRLTNFFGARAGDWYVPPWNRLEMGVAAGLPDIGFRAVSAFADTLFHLAPALVQSNTHVDLMDWKGGRIGRTTQAVAIDLAAQLMLARQNNWAPVGILTHHLVHDQTAWSALNDVLETVSQHPAAFWHDPDDFLAA
jgi:hypothetical protein